MRLAIVSVLAVVFGVTAILLSSGAQAQSPDDHVVVVDAGKLYLPYDAGNTLVSDLRAEMCREGESFRWGRLTFNNSNGWYAYEAWSGVNYERVSWNGLTINRQSLSSGADYYIAGKPLQAVAVGTILLEAEGACSPQSGSDYNITKRFNIRTDGTERVVALQQRVTELEGFIRSVCLAMAPDEEDRTSKWAFCNEVPAAR